MGKQKPANLKERQRRHAWLRGSKSHLVLSLRQVLHAVIDRRMRPFGRVALAPVPAPSSLLLAMQMSFGSHEWPCLPLSGIFRGITLISSPTYIIYQKRDRQRAAGRAAKTKTDDPGLELELNLIPIHQNLDKVGRAQAF